LAPESVAVAFLFAFRHPEHERRVAAALRGALAGVPVAASHEVLPVFREFERISTTTVESYLRPKVSAYLARLDQEARGRGVGTLRIMTSAGGTLAPAPAACRAAALALSGPAGGVVGARLVGAALGLSELLTLDMGGTSADASLVTGGAAVHDGGGGGRGGARGDRRRQCGRDRGRDRRGRDRCDGSSLETRQRGARPRPAAHGARAVRRRRPVIWLRARRRAGHADGRHSQRVGER